MKDQDPNSTQEAPFDAWGEVRDERPGGILVSLVRPIGRRFAALGRRRLVWLGLILLPLCALVLWAAHLWLTDLRTKAYEEACQEARQTLQWDTLKERATAWARWQPDNSRPWLFAAEAAQQQANPAQAAEYLRKVPDDDPLASEALLVLSDLYFQDLNRPLEGVATCERILRTHPNVGEARRRLIFFYAVTLQRKKMVDQAREAIKRRCDAPETYVYLIGADWLQLTNAAPMSLHWLQADPDNELFLVAPLLHMIGEPAEHPATEVAEQEKKLAEYLERFPKNLELLRYFLARYCHDGEPERVAELLAQAPPEAMEDNRFWRFKGWLHALQAELTEAEAAYRRALELGPFNWRTQRELAGVLRRLDKNEEAETLLARSAEGKELRRLILQSSSVQITDKTLLRRLADYARDCGDRAVADALLRRIASMPPDTGASGTRDVPPPNAKIPKAEPE